MNLICLIKGHKYETVRTYVGGDEWLVTKVCSRCNKKLSEESVKWSSTKISRLRGGSPG